MWIPSWQAAEKLAQVPQGLEPVLRKSLLSQRWKRGATRNLNFSATG